MLVKIVRYFLDILGLSPKKNGVNHAQPDAKNSIEKKEAITDLKSNNSFTETHNSTHTCNNERNQQSGHTALHLDREQEHHQIKLEKEKIDREEKIRQIINHESTKKIQENTKNRTADKIKPTTNATSIVFDTKKQEQKRNIERIIKSRKVNYITHFTPLDNLSSIINDGIIPRDWLDTQFRKYKFCDDQRLDNKTDASCLSIGLPNYRFFYSLRKHRYPSRTWCVVLLDPKVLWELDVAFYFTNAANHTVRDRSVDGFKTPQALEKMFDSSVHDRTHLEMNFDLPSYCTTDPQAEVLVFDKIDPSYIKHIVFEGDIPFSFRKQSKIPCSSAPAYGLNTYFGPRCDYSFWKNTQRSEVAYG